MSEMRFTEDHEWVRQEDTIGVVGISHYAQDALGEIVFAELPQVGTRVAKGDEIVVVESVKAASEIYAPVSGKIVEVNHRLSSDPGLINTDPTGEGWLVKIELSAPAELSELMSEKAYQRFVEGLE